MNITKNYPSLQTKLNLVFNTTAPPSSTTPKTPAPSDPNLPPSEDVSHEENAEEELLTNEILDSIVNDMSKSVLNALC